MAEAEGSTTKSTVLYSQIQACTLTPILAHLTPRSHTLIDTTHPHPTLNLTMHSHSHSHSSTTHPHSHPTPPPLSSSLLGGGPNQQHTLNKLLML